MLNQFVTIRRSIKGADNLTTEPSSREDYVRIADHSSGTVG